MSTHAEAFNVIEKLVNEALKDAYELRNDDRFRNDAVNWVDLSCRLVEYFEDSIGTKGYRAYIEEASPNAGELCEFVWEYLRKHGWDVSVRTEW